MYFLYLCGIFLFEIYFVFLSFIEFENRLRKNVHFDSLGHILPPNVTREPIGPLTNPIVIAKIEESNIKLAKVAIRRQQYRGTSEKYHTRLQQNGENNTSSTSLFSFALSLALCGIVA